MVGRTQSGSAQVFIVDDELPVLRVMSRMLEKAGYRAAAFSSPIEFLEQARLVPPCCLLLDMHMPGLTGLQVQEKLQASALPPPIVFMSGGSDVPTSVQAMKGGAVDFLQKPFAPAALLDAVRAALSRSELELSVLHRRDAARARFDRLTPREREVCVAVVRGLRSKDIAEELGAAEKTVNIHRSNAMRKLDVDSVAELIALHAEAK